MKPHNDVIMKGDDGMMFKLRISECKNCDHITSKQLGKPWDPKKPPPKLK